MAGYTETRFDQINLFDPDGDGTPFGSIGSHTYHGGAPNIDSPNSIAPTCPSTFRVCRPASPKT
jgi:hypothetical protein